jgi:hypothetical protein
MLFSSWKTNHPINVLQIKHNHAFCIYHFFLSSILQMNVILDLKSKDDSVLPFLDFQINRILLDANMRLLLTIILTEIHQLFTHALEDSENV